MSSAKYALLIIIAATVMLPSVHAAALEIVVNSASPQPVEPGSDLTLQVTYSNFDASFVSNIAAQMQLPYPFSLKTSTEPFENGFALCAYCSRTNSYFIHVDSAANSGVYPIFIKATGSNGDVIRTISIDVRGTPNIILQSDPVRNATPSNVFGLDIAASNIGTGFAREIKVTSLSTDFVSLGGSAVSIGELAPGNSSSVRFDISPDSRLTAGSYVMPFSVSFKDEDGNVHNSTQNIGVQVVNSALLNVENIKVTTDQGTSPVAGQPFDVIIRLENIGHGDADSISPQITCDGQNSKAFLGQLKSNEDAPALFVISLSGGGNHDCTLLANYTDDTGTKILSSTFSITIGSAGSPILLAGVIIIIAVIIILYMRSRRPKKKVS